MLSTIFRAPEAVEKNSNKQKIKEQQIFYLWVITNYNDNKIIGNSEAESIENISSFKMTLLYNCSLF